MDNSTGLLADLTALTSQITQVVAGARAGLVTAQETAPTNVPEGMTLEEATAEVVANIELALRHLEDASSRLGIAGVMHLTQAGEVSPSGVPAAASDVGEAEA